MTKTRLEYLFNRYYEKTCTPDEKVELMNLLQDNKNDQLVKDLIDRALIKAPPEMELDNNTADIIIQAILKADPGNEKHVIHYSAKRISFLRTAAAAVILLFISTGAYFYFNNHSKKQIAASEIKQHFNNDLAPGGNKAILTLNDGTQIVLDSANSGTITQQGNTKIIKLDDGQLAYRGNSSISEVGYNTISTPKGGQYQIILADGSKVWLNAASSLKFPTSFTGNQRNVELTGEGYFEIAKNSGKAFHVKVNDMEVEVFGTHFNVNAYNDEASIKTTLLEGSVKVLAANDQSIIIKPRQQAQVNSSSIRVIHDIDVDQVIAWKNGYFSFNNADLPTVMRQIARWYDVEITYQGKIPKREFGGKIDRSSNASQVLKILEESKVHFKIEGKKIIVMP